MRAKRFLNKRSAAVMVTLVLGLGLASCGFANTSATPPTEPFDAALLSALNVDRTANGLPPLTWSPKLSNQAGTWAANMAAVKAGTMATRMAGESAGGTESKSLARLGPSLLPRVLSGGQPGDATRPGADREVNHGSTCSTNQCGRSAGLCAAKACVKDDKFP